MEKNKRKGINPAVIIIVIILIIILIGLLWYFLSFRKTNKNTNLTNNILNTNTALNANTSAIDISSWQTYTNNNYHYQISYPEDWFYIPDAMSGPPAPVTAFFSNVEKTNILPYASFNILVSEMIEQTLDEHGEVVSLIADGYEKSDLILSGQPAVRLERDSHIMDSGASIYVAKDGYVYRLVWGATEPETYLPYEEICEAIAASFTFLEPVAPDFTQTGTLTRPAENGNYFVLWEEPGNPAITKELVFDEAGFVSTCVLSDQSQGRCPDLLTNGLFKTGDSISVEGLLREDGKINVIKITVL